MVSHKVFNVISSDFCASVFTVYTTAFFSSFLWLLQRRRELWMIFLALSLSYSLPSITFSLLLHLSSGFKELNSSLAPRSKWPLPFICQPFDVVPVWAACYALPLTARPEVRGGLYFRTQPHLNTLPLPTPLQMCLSFIPPLRLILHPRLCPFSTLVPIIIL